MIIIPAAPMPYVHRQWVWFSNDVCVDHNARSLLSFLILLGCAGIPGYHPKNVDLLEHTVEALYTSYKQMLSNAYNMLQMVGDFHKTPYTGTVMVVY